MQSMSEYVKLDLVTETNVNKHEMVRSCADLSTQVGEESPGSHDLRWS